MEATARLLGLCEVCSRRHSCRLCSGSGLEYMSGKCATIVRCDQFELRPGCRLPENLDQAKAGSDPANGGFESLGLCANCEHRETCTLQRGEGGVWHCEEYC